MKTRDLLIDFASTFTFEGEPIPREIIEQSVDNYIRYIVNNVISE